MREKIQLQIDNNNITGFLFFPNKESQHSVVIFFNGSGGTKEYFFKISKFLSLRGYVSFCFDFRGRGESQTKEISPLSFQIKDAQEVIRQVASLPFVKKDDITILATSMGGYVAASVSNISKGIKRIILIAPALYSLDDENKKYTEASVRDFKKELIPESRAIKEIRKFKGELFVVFLEKDKIVPDWINQAYLDNALEVKKKAKLEIKDAEHAIFRTKSGQEKVRKLLEKLLIIQD